MLADKKKHYNDYYRYEVAEREDAPAIVNGLFDRVMRNDGAALEEVLKIVSSNIFYLVCNRLENSGNATFENVDDIMQQIRLEIFKISFRGVPEYVSENNFYGYLLGVAENSIKNFRKYDKKKNEREQYDTEEMSVFDQMESQSGLSQSHSTEDIFIKKENQTIQKRIMEMYLSALENSTKPPQQLLTYCYAVMIPQLYKKTSNQKLLGRLESISSRKTGKPNSRYNPALNCLEGDIVRDSVILTKWAMEAMHGRNVMQLNEEYLEIYDLERIFGIEFMWGIPYQKKLDESVDGQAIKDIVITEKYEANNINNWPARVMKSLIQDTERDMENEFGESIASMVEELF